MRCIWVVAMLLLFAVNAFAAEYNGHEYIVLEYDNWYNAESAAVSWGGHLVAINDAAEQQWLVSTFGGYNPSAEWSSYYWIGLTDAESEGVWKWTNGDAVSYTNWRAGEPNNTWSTWAPGVAADEDCSIMNFKGNGLWNDIYGGYNVGGNKVLKGIAEKVVPEPLSCTLFLLGGAALAIRRKK